MPCCITTDVMMMSHLLYPSIDPMTGGPSVQKEGEGEGEGGEKGDLEGMTDEEKEREAVKLVEMMKRLNE